MFKKVESRISISIIFVVFLVLLLELCFVLACVNGVLKDDLDVLVESTAEVNTNLIEQRISRAEGIMNDLCSMIEGIVDPRQLAKQGKDYEEILDPMIKKIITDNRDQVMGAFLILDPSNTDRTYGVYYEDEDGDGDLEAQPVYDIEMFRKNDELVQWYYDCIDAREGVWYEPYVSEHIGMEQISFTRAIYRGDEFIGVLSIDLDFQLMQDYVNAIELMNQGYVFIVNDAGNFVVHRNLRVQDTLESVSNGELAGLQAEISNKESGSGIYTIDGEKKHLAFGRLSNGWTVCAVMGEDSLKAGARSILRIAGISAVAAVILSIILTKVLCKGIGSSITYMTGALNRLASLDLTMEEKDRNYEKRFKEDNQIGIMVTSLTSLRNHLCTIIPRLQNQAKDTFTYSDHLTGFVENGSSSMELISNVMNQVADDAKEQLAAAEQGARRLDGLAAKIDEAMKETEDVEKYLSKTQEQNTKNIRQMEKLEETFHTSRENTNQVDSNIRKLSEQSNDIGNIVTTIDSVASQIELLALNASIEAARAGENGKGFAVVAGEIGKLSQETTKATSEISAMVSEICGNIEMTEQSMEESSTALAQAQEAMVATKESFAAIAHDLGNMGRVTNGLISNINQVNQDKEEVLQSFDRILDTSKETGGNIENLVPKVQEETDALLRMKDVSVKMRSLSENLSQVAESFRT